MARGRGSVYAGQPPLNRDVPEPFEPGFMSKKTFLAVVADDQGEVFEHPELLLAGMSGMRVVRPRAEELIPLPAGSRLFTIPGAPPMGFDPRSGKAATVDRLPKRWGGGRIQAVSTFLTPGFTRTLLPAADYRRKAAPCRSGRTPRSVGASRSSASTPPRCRSTATRSGVPSTSTTASSTRWCASAWPHLRTTACSSSWRAVPSTTTALPPRTSSSAAGKRRCRSRRPATRAAWAASPCRNRTAARPARSG